jgi:transcriptional regulator with XRE-family HTH domain
MSDLYLVLRSRLDSVPEWVYIDTHVLLAARNARGLSYESTARELHISSKTWERYEKAGRIPRPLVPRVAELLELEIEESPARRVVIEGEAVPVEVVQELQERILGKLDELEAILERVERGSVTREELETVRDELRDLRDLDRERSGREV